MQQWEYIDTHAHLNLDVFQDDWREVVHRAHAAGVAIINVGIDRATSERAVAMAHEFSSGVYAIVGQHPNTEEVFSAAFYRSLAVDPKVVGIGECGLDYFHRNDEAHVEAQRVVFLAQIELANELGLPLMVHTRDAKGNSASAQGVGGAGTVYEDILAFMQQHARVPGNIHFFAGTAAQAARFQSIGCSVSFTGVITFSQDYTDAVRQTPLSGLHAETDCPYVAPVPYRGRRAEPHMVREVYKKIAAIRGDEFETVRRQLVMNAQQQYPRLVG